ncbi:MAG: HEAT repeat domain-containing protein [Nitrospirae bacterium]|nr:HEAT repeat domain-containing protein [Nitrospirota bacterium]
MADILQRVFTGLVLSAAVLLCGLTTGHGTAGLAQPIPVQSPFEQPLPSERSPKAEDAPSTSVPPLDRPLSPEEIKRAEALVPLLAGKQEFWAMGEFVHLGPGAVPVLVKALTMPGPRIRYNAIETLSMIKDPGAVPALIETAKRPFEMSRIREHALRVSVRLDPAQAPSAIAVMAKDPNSTIRTGAAFQARYVREKEVIPALLALISDEEQFVGITAVQSLWKLTGHSTELHDWASSTKKDREEWAQEWVTWWRESQSIFQFPKPRQARKSQKQD